MKKIILFGYFCISFLSLGAQENNLKKPSSLAFHLFYYDFKTAQQIKATSLNSVLKNGNWSSFRNMQLGLGINYLRGVSKTIDFVATVDGSGVDYLFNDGTTNGSSKFLLDLNAGINAKLFNDEKPVAPYIFGGVGFSRYTKKNGIYLPIGLGVQFHLFNEAFLLTNMQYRVAATDQVNDHFYYTVGIGLSIGKKSKAAPIITERKQTPVVIATVEATVRKKDLLIKVVDEQTGLALTGATVVVKGANGEFKSVSDATGTIVFKDVPADNYEIKGTLNTISTNTSSVQSSNFEGSDPALVVLLTHNDPRFTLVGIVEEKSTHKPTASAFIQVLNQTTGTKDAYQNNPDGTFNIQLSGGSDYIISAKKNNYISDINALSTKGLNRSTTLSIKLLLGVDEAKENTIIALPNIYYHTGSITLNGEASSDLDKLVLFLMDNPSLRIEILSHSDSRGDAAKNLLLSQRRAQEVVNYLQKQGISGNRLIPRGYGETRLLNGCKDGVNCIEAQHEQNRRTEFKIIAN